MLVTYLQLSPEFGGTKFGPFPGAEIRLGSDPEANDISLPEALGVAPQHVKVLKQGDNSYIIAPIDRTATIYIWRQGAAKPKQITTPMAVTPGDGFSLVTPEGPRFYITTEHKRKDRDSVGQSFAEKAKKRMPTSRGLLEEVKRRGMAKMFATRIGNFMMWAQRFVMTGQIFNPVYIVAGLMIVSGWFMASGATCAAFTQSRAKTTASKKLQTCQDQKASILTGGNEGKITVPVLTAGILNDAMWKETLQDDVVLYKEFGTQLSNAFQRADEYEWAHKRAGSVAMRFRKALNVSDPLADTLAYAAARPSKTGSREWSIIENSDGDEVCGRGPLALTYRQAVNLGLDNVQLDALVTNSVATSQSIEEKRKRLLKTAEFLTNPPELVGVTIADAGGATVQGGRECIHLEGDDDRDDIVALAAKIRSRFGVSASGLPGEGDPYWVAERLVKLGAMDFVHNYDNLKFSSSNKPPLVNLAAQDVTQRRIDFASTYAAKIMSNAVVTRCMAVFTKDKDPPDYMGDLPDLSQCAVAKAFVEYKKIQ